MRKRMYYFDHWMYKKVDKLFKDMMIDVPIATYTQINVLCNHQK